MDTLGKQYNVTTFLTPRSVFSPKFVIHPLVRNMIFEYMKNLDLVKYNLEILGKFKFDLNIHLFGFHEIELVVANYTIYTLASN
jgi:hypothetical protein